MKPPRSIFLIARHDVIRFLSNKGGGSQNASGNCVNIKMCHFIITLYSFKTIEITFLFSVACNVLIY